MLYAIHAYENIYQGLHGIESFEVIEVDNKEEAESIAEEMSYEVMDDYGNIEEEFKADAEFNGYEEGTDEWYDFIEECRADDLAWDIYPITIETDKDVEELTNEFYQNSESFINKYCNSEF